MLGAVVLLQEVPVQVLVRAEGWAFKVRGVVTERLRGEMQRREADLMSALAFDACSRCP